MPQPWHRPSHCPRLSTLAAHIGSRLPPSNSPWQSSEGDFGLAVSPSLHMGSWGQGTPSDSSLGTKQLLNKCLLNE